MKRPDGVMLISVYYWFATAVAVLLICPAFFWIFSDGNGMFGLFIGLVIWPFFMLAIAAACAATAWGLWNLKSWARMAAIVLAILQLFFFPIGTVFGAVIIWYLWKDPDALAAFGLSAG